MGIKLVTRHFLTALLFCSCNPMGGEKAKVTFFNSSAFKDLKASVSSVAIENHQLIITGSGLSQITTATLKNANQTATFAVESASESRLTTNVLKNITLIAGSVFDLILSDAYGAATFQVSFTVPDGSIGASKLSSMGASAGQILKYNGTSWAPATQIDAQTFLGTWDASNNTGGVPDLNSLLLNPGDYYVVSVAGTFNGVSYAVGDWIISDGYGWQKIPYSKTAVTSFQGRKGIVTLGPSDYVSLKDAITQKITGSSINDLADIDFAVAPVNGQVLKYNSTTLKWAPANDNSAAAGIALTDLSASAPLAYNNTTGVFSLPAANVLSLPLTSLASGTGAITASDSILGAFGKLMSLPSDYVSRSSGASIVTGTIAVSGTGMITVPTASGTTLTEVANVTYVNNMIAANGVWSKSGSDINFTAGKVGVGTTTPSAKLQVGAPVTFTPSSSMLSVYGTDDTGATPIAQFLAYRTASGPNHNKAVEISQYPSYGGGIIDIFGTSAGKIHLDPAASSYVLFNTTGGFGIGTSSPLYPLHISSNSPLGNIGLNVDLYSGSSTAINGIIQRTARGTAAAPTAIQSGDSISVVGVRPYGATGFSSLSTGNVTAMATENMTDTAMGTALFFKSTPNGSITPTERMRIDHNGNVGIGTATPSTLLDVYGNSSNYKQAVLRNSNGQQLWLGAVATTVGTYIGGNAYYNSNYQFIPNYTAASGINFRQDGSTEFWNDTGLTSGTSYLPSKRMVILNSGNVGIGTTTPRTKLDIPGGWASTLLYGDNIAIRKPNYAGGGWARNLMQFEEYDGSVLTTIGAYGSNNIFSYGYIGPSYSSPTIAWNPAGNVGIGTTSPSNKLDVNGTVKATGLNIQGTTLTSNGSRLEVQDLYAWNTLGAAGGINTGAVNLSGSSHYVKYDGTMNRTDLRGYFGVTISTNGNSRVLNVEGDKVGIGTTTPSYKLDVTGDMNTSTALRVAGTSICTIAGCTSSSDRTLKENIKPLSNATENILHLQGVGYDWKDQKKYGDKHQIGLIAQDVEKIFPEVVVTDKKTGLKSIAYDHLIAPLIEAFKALNKNLSALVAKVLNLEEKTAKNSRAIASNKAEVEAKTSKLEVENAQLKIRLEKAEKENVEIKARLNKIEQKLLNK